MSMFGKKLLSSALALLFAATANASTLFASIGPEFTAGGGTLVVKNRDDLPSPQKYMEVNDGNGYSFKGFFAGRPVGFDTGINEKGLFVSSSTAASVSIATRRHLIGKRFKTQEGVRTGEWIMRNCASVAEALNHKELFRGYPTNFILADHHEIALVECLPNGGFVVERKSAGLVTHTNHYVLKRALAFNEAIGESSQARYNRLNTLLEETPKPYTMKDFQKIVADDSAGPDLSLFRTGSKFKSPKTMATVIVHIPRAGAAKIFVKYLKSPSTDMTNWEIENDTFNLK